MTLLVAIAITCDVASAQPASAHVSVRPLKSFSASPGAFGLFGPIRSIDIEVTLVNEEDRKPLVVEPGVFHEIEWTLTNAAGVRLPASVRWADTVECGGPEPPTGCSPLSRIVLGPAHYMRAVVTIELEQGQLTPGNYRVAVDLRRARGFLREADQTPWQGGVIERGAIILSVRSVTTAQDRRNFHRLAAGQAMVAGDHAAALEEYRRMSALDASDSEALAGIGVALLRLRRLAEAVDALEGAVAATRRESLVYEDLAVAYAALGQHARAEAVVRQHASPELGPKIMATVRERAKRLTQPR